jgi:hypothetical protein
MSILFLSYARADLDTVDPLVYALQTVACRCGAIRTASTVEDRKSKRHFRPAAAAVRLRRQLLLARGAGSAPSTRQHAAAAHSKAWRG